MPGVRRSLPGLGRSLSASAISRVISTWTAKMLARSRSYRFAQTCVLVVASISWVVGRLYPATSAARMTQSRRTFLPDVMSVRTTNERYQSARTDKPAFSRHFGPGPRM